MIHNSHKTAMTRTRLSVPSRWIKKECPFSGRVLDYGCGRGKDADILKCDKYDSYYFPAYPQGLYNTILCIYVLNTLPVQEREKVLKDVKSLLAPGGRAYFAVRRDLKQEGVTSIGTFQETVKLSEDEFQLLTEHSGMAIYSYYRGK